MHCHLAMKRSRYRLPSTKSRATTSGPVHLVVDSTGLKVFGEVEWLENKHKTKTKRKRWRKLHLGLNLVSGEIVCSDLTAEVTNWPAYNESLRQRGDLTIWVKDEALSLWTARRRTSRGGQPKYSDLAMTLCLTLRVVYGLALRQTQGLMRSVAAPMGFDIAVPDFSTLSRRSKGLALPSTKSRATTSGPVHLVVDSTGLKVFGEGEWLENKHKTKAKRKRWRKLHLGLNLVSGEIVCSDLTADDVGDPTALPGLLGPDRWPRREVHCRRRL